MNIGFRIGLLILALSSAVRAAEPAAPPYFELRLYAVTSNKMDGVLERFRETVEPVRRRHGIRTVGYWSAPGTTNGRAFVYLMAAAATEELQRLEKETEKNGKLCSGVVALKMTPADFSALK